MLLRKGYFEEFQPGFSFVFPQFALQKANVIYWIMFPIFQLQRIVWDSIVVGYDAAPYPRQREVSAASLGKTEKLKCFFYYT